MKNSLRLINLIFVGVLLLAMAGAPALPAAQAKEQAAPQAVTASLMPPPIDVFPGIQRPDNGGDIDVYPAVPDINNASVIGAVPDTSGAPGHTHFLQATNKMVAIYRKNGTLIDMQSFDNFWATAPATSACFPGNNLHHGQPYVIYDHLAWRYVVVDVAYTDVDNGPYYLCVAVSKEMLPPMTPAAYFNSTYWNYYSLVTNEGVPHYYPDSPKLGLWPDGYYLSVDLYDVYNSGMNRSPAGAKVWALNRSDLINGVTTGWRYIPFYLSVAMAYNHLVPTNLLGNPPATGTPNYFASIEPGRFHLWKFTANWFEPSSSTFGTAAQQPDLTLFTDTSNKWANGYIVPQLRVPPAYSEQVDAHGERIMTPMQYRVVDGVPSLWFNHTLRSNAVTGIRWHEMQFAGGTPYFYQTGTYTPTDGQYRWLGSMAVDRTGNMAIGYSTSSSVLNPDIRYAGRLKEDPSGTLAQGEQIFQVYDPTPPLFVFPPYNGSQYDIDTYMDGPWGRQSQMSVDPLDQCVFWYTNMYYDDQSAGTEWRTAIGWFSFPECRGGALTRVSLHTSGTQGNNASGAVVNVPQLEAYSVAPSASGRYVAFSSAASTLVNGDTNGKRDVFLRDRDTDNDGLYDEPDAVSTVKVSNDYLGGAANGDSFQVSITSDGRYVAYSSDANNLLPPGSDNNGARDVFVWDRDTGGPPTRISVVDKTVNGDSTGDADHPFIAGNGRYVAFRSIAANLISPIADTNNLADIFIRDMTTNRTYRVSAVPGVPFTEFDGASLSPTLSADGHSVAFATLATNHGLPDANGILSDVIIVDWAVDAITLNLDPLLTVLTSVSGTGALDSYDPFISADGLHVVFTSRATGLDPLIADSPVYSDIFVYDRDVLPATITLISVNFFSEPAINGDSYSPSISADGRYIAFASDSTNLDVFLQDVNARRDIFLYDRAISMSGAFDVGMVQRISLGTDRGEAYDLSLAPVIASGAADRRHVVFSSLASNLVTNDTNSTWDVFAYDSSRGIPVFLRIPGNVPGTPSEIVSMPVNFYRNLHNIDALAFSIDFDQTCLTFDPTIPNAVVFGLPVGFFGAYTYDGAQTDNEIDFNIYDPSPPYGYLVDGVIATIKFRVKATCQAVPGSTNSARVGFSANPRPSFASYGQSVRGVSIDGFVAIQAGLLGDCNGDGAVDAGDLSAVVLEIFDGDGTAPDLVPGGTFPGSPVGCNPNQDFVVDAGDISCTVWVIRDGQTAGCTGIIPPLLSLRESTELVSSGAVAMGLPAFELAAPDSQITLPVTLQGAQVNSLVFSVDYDQDWLSFDLTDANGDGVPDAVVPNLPAGFSVATSFDANDLDGELDFVVFNLLDPQAQLPNGDLLSITFRTGSPTGSFLAAVKASPDPLASFGSIDGQTLPGSLMDGSVWISSLLERIFLPLAVK
ncbi:MAG: PD40 domain-containing protein [Anaerolineales bacterium]|nr:PD40 domain-containing protein [Anaerolineales bacterium]